MYMYEDTPTLDVGGRQDTRIEGDTTTDEDVHVGRSGYSC